jgi:tungstate transport system ATP-binding protein
MTLFQVKELTRVYGNRTVLDISKLILRKGIIYGLVGPNGSGKTTLLQILGLLDRPTTGEIVYENRSIDFSSSSLHTLRRDIVLVHQNPVLFTTSVEKNVGFGPEVRAIPKDERNRHIEESLDLVGMGDFIKAEAHKLSGGETQRVAIARALASSPKVILFDEPTASVDVENKMVIEEIISEINRQKDISVIMTTHDPVQAAKLSHELVSLFDGRLMPSAFENVYSGNVVFGEDRPKVCFIHDKVKFSVVTDKTGHVSLSIDPLRIRVLEDRDAPSAENTFEGRLIQLSDERHYIRAIVDIGVPLNILLNGDELRDRPLMVGDSVRVLCPGESIQVL